MKCSKFTNASVEKENVIESCNYCVDGSCPLRCVMVDFKLKDNQKPEEVTQVETDNQSNNVSAYIDGSYNQKTGTYGYGGFVIENNQKHIIQGCGQDKNVASMRNVAGELLGAMNAIKYASTQGYKNLTIYYDYIGIEAWPTGKWSANNEYTKKYKEYVSNKISKV